MTAAGSRLRRWVGATLDLVADIRPGEGRVTLSMAVLFFFVIASYYLIKPVRNSLFVERVGADNLPFVYIATALVVGLLISWYSRFVVDRVSPRMLIAGTYVFLAGNLVLFWQLLRYESLVTSATFYIWTKIYAVLVVSQFWLTANALFEPRRAKRLFGFVGAGGILGGIAGGTLAGATARAVGTENLLLASAAVIAGCAALAAGLHPVSPKAAPESRGDRRPPTARRDGRDVSAVAVVRSSAHLRAIASILSLMIVVSTLVDWQMNKAVELLVPGEDAKTAFYGNFFAVLNGASFLVQVLLTGYVLRRFGMGIALLILPVGLLTGSLGILAHPSLWMTALAKGVDGTLRYSLDQSVRELLFLPVPQAVKVRAKPFIDVVGQRAGTGVAGVIILLATHIIEIPFRYVSLISLATIVVWIAATFVVRREYVGSIKRLIDARDVEIEELVLERLDADSRQELAQALETEDPRRVLYAFGLLELAGEAGPEVYGSKLLLHPSHEVRERAAAALVRLGDDALLKAVQPLLEDADIEVRAEAIRVVCSHCMGDELAHLQEMLADARPRVQAGAIAAYFGSRDARFSQAAQSALWDLAIPTSADRAASRREAALLTAILPRTETTRRVLLELLEDPDEAVRRAAIIAAGRAGHREAVPALVRALTSSQTRDEARAALAALGERVLGMLADYLRDRSEPRELRTQIARVFAEFPPHLSVPSLLEMLADPDPGVRYHILKTLNRLRRNHPGPAFGEKPAEQALRREVEDLRNVQVTRAVLHTAGTPDGTRLWARILREREDDAVERVTRCLGLLYPLDEVFHAYRAMATATPEGRARGVELLDNMVRPAHRRAIIRLLERVGSLPDRPPNPATAPRTLDTWLAACVTYATRRASGERTPPRTEDSEMMTIVERAEFLKDIPIFSLVRTDYLAKIATIAKEKASRDGEVLFEQGSPPDALYFIVDGSVRLMREGEEIRVAHSGDAVGTLAVLDRNPNPLTAVAAGPARTLCIEDEVLNDLMMDNPAIMLGVIRFLAGELRRVQDGRARPP